MKTVSPELLTHLSTGQNFRRAELWTFTLVDGQVFRYTQLDQDVTVGIHTWPSNGPIFRRPGARMACGAEVNEFEVSVFPNDTDLIAGVRWPIAARTGLLRQGRLLIERLYFPTWGDTSLGKMFHMSGRMIGFNGDAAEVKISVRDDRELLNVKIPIEVVQSPCRHTLFDSGCTLDAADFVVNGTASGGSTASVVRAALSEADGYNTFGRIVFTSGANSGFSRSIKKHTAGSPHLLQLVAPLPFAPQAGDTFDVYPGCDRLQATCSGKFGNLPNFGAEPFVPQPETAL